MKQLRLLAAALLLVSSCHIAAAQPLGAANSTATSMATQTADHVAITGGTVDGTPVGNTTPAAGHFTTLGASSTVSGTGFSTYLAAPPAIGGTTPAAGTFTTLTGASWLGSGSAPTPTGTGSPSIASGSTDTAGEVTAGSSATSVVITFATAKTNAPFCTVTPQTGGIASFAYAISTTAITVTQSATSGDKIDYVCVQH